MFQDCSGTAGALQPYGFTDTTARPVEPTGFTDPGFVPAVADEDLHLILCHCYGIDGGIFSLPKLPVSWPMPGQNR